MRVIKSAQASIKIILCDYFLQIVRLFVCTYLLCICIVDRDSQFSIVTFRMSFHSVKGQRETIWAIDIKRFRARDVCSMYFRDDLNDEETSSVIAKVFCIEADRFTGVIFVELAESSYRR